MKFLNFLVVIVLFQSCRSQTEKINGVSFVAASDSITQKHIDALKEWEEQNPGWFSTESGQETYNSMVAQITMCVAKTREKIKKLISSQVKLPPPLIENKKI